MTLKGVRKALFHSALPPCQTRSDIVEDIELSIYENYRGDLSSELQTFFREIGSQVSHAPLLIQAGLYWTRLASCSRRSSSSPFLFLCG
ncbi:hypothetical protein KOW79_002894 [Hemibagrus wyckioides]|uniref:Uncharacterized protein n=1 Tax=Hemibagrus wyckioides TaxID=337641 RepID=A0A9D3P8N7_9TELE|nr:hypothetical protein KOW79_002894 [Hemibagrus wyckioides]